MNLLDGLVGDLAWPVAVLLVVIIFRNPIAERLKNITRLKVPGGIEAEFARIELVRESLQEEQEGESVHEQLDARLVTPENVGLPNTIYEIAALDASAAIAQSFRYLEQEVRAIAAPYGHPLSFLVAVRRLVEGGVIDEKLGELLTSLASIRNQAVHEVAIPPLPTRIGIQYVDNVAVAIALLREGSPPNSDISGPQ